MAVVERADVSELLAAPVAERACEVSVVLPCLDEALSVGTCVLEARRQLAEADVGGEIVVCDNGSHDESPALAAAAGARVVRETHPGYGAALATGIAAAHGDYIVMADADGSYDLSAVGDMVRLLSSGADLVVGNRFLRSDRPHAMPWINRYVGSPLLSFLLNVFFGTHVGDAHCGLRAFSTRAYTEMALRTTGMEFASEMIVRAARLGCTSPRCRSTITRALASSKLRRYRDGWRHLRFLLMYSPTWLYLIPSACLRIARPAATARARRCADRIPWSLLGHARVRRGESDHRVGRPGCLAGSVGAYAGGRAGLRPRGQVHQSLLPAVQPGGRSAHRDRAAR